MRVTAKPLSTRALAFAWLAALVTVATALPAGAMADATPAPENRYSSSPGLPDGRLYEQVSPANKYGNAAGAVGETPNYSISTADGNSVLYDASGSLGGEAADGLAAAYVARHKAGGWVSSPALPRPRAGVNIGEGQDFPQLPSADLTSFAFISNKALLPSIPPPIGGNSDLSAWIASNTAGLAWLAEPEPGVVPDPVLGAESITGSLLQIVGGAPDLSTVYYTYWGTLLADDASRESTRQADGRYVKEYTWGLYEWNRGQLRSAGVLPPHSPLHANEPDPFGAVPAATRDGAVEEYISSTFGNEVSEDGSEIFFVSPDPRACVAETNFCEGEIPQLYVRRTGPDGSVGSELVSRSAITGLAAAHGPEAFEGAFKSSKVGKSYVYASPDGSQAFFVSVDPLTVTAKRAEEEGRIAAGAPKEYDFDVVTGVLTYLPGVLGPIVASARDGSTFVFEDVNTVPLTLAQWRAGAAGGSVQRIVELPYVREERQRCADSYGIAAVCLQPARMTADGSVLVFQTGSEIPGFNDAGGREQVFRYDGVTNTLDCVSCPPSGIRSSGDAELALDSLTNYYSTGPLGRNIGTRDISNDGARVFFDTPEPLVPQDTNGVRDAYEWENGSIYLISSGVDSRPSFVLDNSAGGNDVFFATSQGLVRDDTDGGFDVYDARVPQSGDSPPPTAVPCQGSVCQGPPSGPALFVAPSGSASFFGAGNGASMGKPGASVKAKRPNKRKHRPRRRRRRTIAPALSKGGAHR